MAQASLKARWTNLTTEDLQFAEGKHEELLERIQAHTGEARDVIENAINEMFPGPWGLHPMGDVARRA